MYNIIYKNNVICGTHTCTVNIIHNSNSVSFKVAYSLQQSDTAMLQSTVDVSMPSIVNTGTATAHWNKY